MELEGQKEYYGASGLGGLGLNINIMRALRKRWIHVLATAAAVFAGATFYTNSQTPLYSSSTRLLLDNDDSLPVTSGGGDPYRGYVTKNRGTEIQILRSTNLIQDAIERMEPPYNEMRIGQVLGGLSISQMQGADILVVTYTGTDPDQIVAVLEALGETYVDYSLNSKKTQVTNAIQFIQDQLPEARQNLNGIDEDIRRFRETYKIVDPDSYANNVAGLRQGLQQEIRQLQISINQIQASEQETRQKMLAIGQDPETILQQSVLGQDGTYQQLAGQLQSLEVESAMEQLRYRDDAPQIAEIERRKAIIAQQVRQRAERILGETVSALDDPGGVALNGVAAGGNTSSGQGGTTVAPLLNDSLISNLSASEGTPAASGALPQPAAPDIGTIPQSLATNMLSIQLELATQQSRMAGLRQAEQEVSALFQQIPQLQQTYEEMNRQKQLSNQRVNSFLSRLQELDIAEAQETSPWLVLEPPRRPGHPFAPDTRRNQTMGAMAGLMLGLGLALLLEQLDQRVKGIDEAKELTGLPLLGAVPKVPPDLLGDKEGRRGSSSRAHLTEAFRSIALNMGYLGTMGKMKVLGFSSAIPGEGKTTVTYQLGWALAELGRKVLLVDGDMRRPSLHVLMQEPNAAGLSTAIATERSWQELLHPVIPGKLDVITSGPIPPNPVALLGSSRMHQLIEEWRQAYDYVLIDTPPVVGITDAQSLSAQVDGMILVVGIERSERSGISRAVEILRGGQSNLVGMVLNFLSSTHEGYYYHYYSSYYTDAPQVSQPMTPPTPRQGLGRRGGSVAQREQQE